MKILSFDIGIKHLAFCVLEKKDNQSLEIIQWHSISLMDDDEKISCQNINPPCPCISRYSFLNHHYCLKHMKKIAHIPNKELCQSFIKKQNINSLIEIANRYQIEYSLPNKKENLLSSILEYIEKHVAKEIIKKNASKFHLVSIAKNIQSKLDLHFQQNEWIDYILIENQIGPLANRMKSIQGMILQYFIMRNIGNQFEFVSSSNKLSETTSALCEKKNPLNKKEKTTYSQRKKKSIELTFEYLQQFPFTLYLDFFSNHKKKDDLADSFLQGIWFEHRKVKKIENV
jgi:hypothetical protein